MTIPVRNVTITGVFAADAATTIPPVPVADTSYRDISMTESDVKTGWPYKKIVDSSKFNQALYQYSSITKLQEKYGFIPWSNLTDYELGSFCLGTNGVLYQAKQSSGPSSSNAYNPVNDTNHTYWQDVFNLLDQYVRWSQMQVVNSLPANPDANTFYFIRA